MDPQRTPDESPDLASASALSVDGNVLQGEEGQGAARNGRTGRRTQAPVSYSQGGRASPVEDTKQRALNAICWWYHPGADRAELARKGQGAKDFGVDRQRMSYWEKHLGEEMLGHIRRGVVPLPPRPGKERGRAGAGGGTSNGKRWRRR